MSDVSAQELVERGLGYSRQACIVLVEETSSTDLRFAGNAPTTNGERRSRRVSVVSIGRPSGPSITGVAPRSVGTASKSGTFDSPRDLEDVVREAEAAAEASPPSPDGADPVSPGQAVVSTDYESQPEETSFAALSPLSSPLEEAFKEAAGQKRLLNGYAELELVTLYMGSTTGLRLRHSQTNGKLEMSARSVDGQASSWLGVPTRDFSDVEVGRLASELAERLSWSTRKLDLPAGRYEVLLPPAALADLVSYMYFSAGGQDALEGRSAFSKPSGGTRVGERLSSLPVNIWSEPGRPGLECPEFVATSSSSSLLPVFDNGLALERTDWVRDGRLAALVHGRASASRAGVSTTPFVGNLLLEIGDAAGGGLERQVQETRYGLLLTCLWYIREVDPRTLLLTGLTRDGVYLVEDGEIVAQVNNFRFNESPIDLLDRIVSFGETERTLGREWNEGFPRVAMPAVRVADFNMSSVSRAT